MSRNLYTIITRQEGSFDRVKAAKWYGQIKRSRYAFAMAINTMRPAKGHILPNAGEVLHRQLRQWKEEYRNMVDRVQTYSVLRRKFQGNILEAEIYGDNGRRRAIKEITDRIREYRRNAKVLRDPIYHRKPGSMLREFQSKRLRMTKRPTDGAQYVGIEIECITPQGVDLTPLLPFGKYIEVGGDGSIDHHSGENGTEIRVCMKRDEIREVLPSLMETLKGMGARVNKSCGLHVHLDQRDNKEPEKVFQHLVRSLGLLYTVVPASRRRNRYCKRNRHADFASAVNGDRYKAINASAFNRYHTIEVRLFGGTLEATKIINWIEVLFAIAYGETVMRCPKTFDTAMKYWKLSDENLAWLKERQTKFAELSLTVSEHETEPNQALLDETEPDDDDEVYCENCDVHGEHDTDDCDAESYSEAA